MNARMLRGKKVVVLGLARTGLAVARFLLDAGTKPILMDQREDVSLPEDLLEGAEEVCLGREDVGKSRGVALVVVSPGVSRDNPVVESAIRQGVPVMSEIELAYHNMAVPLLAVTGTNGKSTTVSLLAEMFKSAGRNAFVGGNIGHPLIGYWDRDWDLGVVEISSFQLEWVDQFRPKAGALLNITPDHQDRYRDLDDYARTKFRLFRRQSEEDYGIVNRNDPEVWGRRGAVNGSLVSFGWEEISSGAFVDQGEICWRWEGHEERFSLKRVKLRGVHNVENLMSAIAMARLFHVSPETIQEAIENFSGLDHRLEFVRERAGVAYYNDSKATNVGSVLKSLESFSAPILLIAGGRDKGGGYEAWQRLVRERVRKLILVGEASEAIRAALKGSTEIVLAANLANAVREAASQARPGDTVLLSPGCSSFDMFRNYEERGGAFKGLVWGLS